MAAPDLRRTLPSVDALLQHAFAQELINAYGHPMTVEALRTVLNAERQRIARETPKGTLSNAVLLEQAAASLAEILAPTLRAVINATGVIIHTNLGRAPLSVAAMDAVQRIGTGYSTLEFNLETGKRGKRSLHAEVLLTRLTGAEAALVVNNNAAATMLALAALAGDRGGVIVSRGQLVEIGGGYRMPDVMTQSGARLVEVGTTNRTHLRDYINAIDESTALLMRVHHSNYKIIGFTTEPPIDEIASVAHAHNLYFVDDLGSGCLFNTTDFGLAPEPTIQASIEAGADLLLFSGDKLLGGPQAGLLLGKRDLIDKLKKHPLARAVRPDKLCLAALSATLLHYLKDEALTNVPIWQMITTPVETLAQRAEVVANELAVAGITCRVEAGQSTVGGGSVPGETLPTTLVSIQTSSAQQSAAALRACALPIITRIIDDDVIVDLRTVLPHQQHILIEQIKDTLLL